MCYIEWYRQLYNRLSTYNVGTYDIATHTVASWTKYIQWMKKNVESCVNKFVLLFASIVFVKVQPYIEV